MKIGIFGGSFNPVHNSHIKIVEEVLNRGFVDEIWIVPCGSHAFEKNLIDPEKRLKMLELVFGRDKRVKILRIEIDSNEKNYTLDTIKNLKNKFPEHEFYFVIGSDVTGEYKKWYRHEELSKEVKFIVYLRKSYKIKNDKGMIIYKIINKNLSDISSTEIRNLIKDKKNISKFVPREVENYIKENNLYKNGNCSKN